MHELKLQIYPPDVTRLEPERLQDADEQGDGQDDGDVHEPGDL